MTQDERLQYLTEAFVRIAGGSGGRRLVQRVVGEEGFGRRQVAI